MLVNTTIKDAMVLVLVMESMRKSVSVNTRENHGVIKGFQMMKDYKKIIKTLEDQLFVNKDASEVSILDVECTEEQAEMMREFLSTYIGLIEDQADDEGKEIEKHPFYASTRNCLYAFLVAEMEEAAV